MNTFSLRGMVCTILLLVSLARHTSAQPASPSEQFAKWPAGWVESYRQFSTYVSARQESLKPSGLEIFQDGTIFHRFPQSDAESGGPRLKVYKHGRSLRSLEEHGELTRQLRGGSLTPGTYAAYLFLYGNKRVQHILPIVWFEVVKSGDDSGGGRTTSIRTLEAPADPESIWPNERLAFYLDYHLLPNRYPFEIEKENGKVEPTVVLWVNPDGVVEREELEDADAETLLRWRIYHNGKLVERGPASASTRWRSPFGPGSYQVLVGLEGPNGFMPVSNLLEFPLFPDVGGTERVLPTDANRDGVPDFLEEIVAKGNLLLSHDDSPAARLRFLPTASTDEKSQRLADLWYSWDSGRPSQRIVVKTGRRAKKVAPPGRLLIERSGNTEITLTWEDKIDNESGFEIYRKNSQGGWDLIEMLPANSTSYSDSNIEIGQTYSYIVDSF